MIAKPSWGGLGGSYERFNVNNNPIEKNSALFNAHS